MSMLVTDECEIHIIVCACLKGIKLLFNLNTTSRKTEHAVSFNKLWTFSSNSITFEGNENDALKLNTHYLST